MHKLRLTKAASMKEDQESELQALRKWFDFNTFSRRKYLDFISGLPPDIVTKDTGASFPSIMDILTHTLDIYRFWLTMYETGRPPPDYESMKSDEEFRKLSLEEVKEFEDSIDARLEKFLQSLTKETLDRTLELTVKEKNGNVTRQAKLINSMYHLVEEDLQHRGEINAIFWQQDIKPPLQSWFSWRVANNRAV